MAKELIWVPYLMSEDGTTRKMKLDFGRNFRELPDVQQFMATIDQTHPHLRGAKITWEQTPRS